MFNRFLASIGIGAATIDTLLEKTRYMPGEEVRGVVKIKGGNVEQNIDTIEIAVMTEYVKESNDHKHNVSAALARYHVSSPFTLRAGEHKEVPFSFDLPLETPLSVGRTPVWVRTELAIRGAVDPGDNDRIEVAATPQMATVLEAVELCGFRLYKADCEYASRIGGRFPFVQEFEFKPTGSFRGRLDELEVIFYNRGSELEIVLQIDRRARGLASLFAEAMDMDESFVRLRFTNGELAAGPHAIARQLENVIARYA
ncbi:sporulation-control protein [Paenibacillus phyllosphaerae]|uniref:Sporulation-control protein n=1 Tax=Paenibacillus phyllosphaerae TaxID=274593 RepID=A0A7W5B1T9_9BACL|nr:sporulation protein [Paenibacillus phyllosphaerae]MBB3112682.1 sporulation-control protein [Paenibacillus phyllosphaerae]